MSAATTGVYSSGPGGPRGVVPDPDSEATGEHAYVQPDARFIGFRVPQFTSRLARASLTVIFLVGMGVLSVMTWILVSSTSSDGTLRIMSASFWLPVSSVLLLAVVYGIMYWSHRSKRNVRGALVSTFLVISMAVGLGIWQPWAELRLDEALSGFGTILLGATMTALAYWAMWSKRIDRT